jgi:hypothetical protein
VEGFASGLLDADLGDGAGHDRRVHVFGEQDVVEIRAEERSIPVLVHHVVAGLEGQLVDHRGAIPLPFDVHVAAEEAGPAAVDGRVQLGGPLPEQGLLGSGDESGEDDRAPDAAEQLNGGLDRPDRGPRVRHFQGGSHPDEVVLHVHHDEGAPRRIDVERPVVGHGSQLL